MMKINKPKVGIFSDLHLGVHTNSPQWHEIALKWARWIAKEFKRQNIKDIIFCGDWYHNRSEISVNTLQTSADVLHILKDFNIIALVGNHDIYYKNRTDVNSLSLFKNSKNITVVDTLTTLTCFDKTISFCPWGTLPEKIQKSDVVFGHFEIETFKMNTYKDCEDGLSVKSLLEKSPLVISGHFHMRHEKQYSAGTILYVGNPFQMDFGDFDNEKGYYILDLDTNKYEFFPNIISPCYQKISLSQLVADQEITPDTIRAFANNIVKFKIDKNISQEDLAILTSKLNQLKPDSLTIEYDLNYNKIANSSYEADLSGIDIHHAIEEFVNLIDIDDKASVLDYTLDLYTRCNA